jgi:hypothetical protein
MAAACAIFDLSVRFRKFQKIKDFLENLRKFRKFQNFQKISENLRKSYPVFKSFSSAWRTGRPGRPGRRPPGGRSECGEVPYLQLLLRYLPLLRGSPYVSLTVCRRLKRPQ